jgi:hypothetical protein
MKNITIRVDEDVARWAKMYAAEHDTSVSRIVGELLRERMEQAQGYSVSYRRWKARAPRTLKPEGTAYPKRDELHER